MYNQLFYNIQALIQGVSVKLGNVGFQSYFFNNIMRTKVRVRFFSLFQSFIIIEAHVSAENLKNASCTSACLRII